MPRGSCLARAALLQAPPGRLQLSAVPATSRTLQHPRARGCWGRDTAQAVGQQEWDMEAFAQVPQHSQGTVWLARAANPALALRGALVSLAWAEGIGLCTSFCTSFSVGVLLRSRNPAASAWSTSLPSWRCRGAGRVSAFGSTGLALASLHIGIGKTEPSQCREGFPAGKVPGVLRECCLPMLQDLDASSDCSGSTGADRKSTR